MAIACISFIPVLSSICLHSMLAWSWMEKKEEIHHNQCIVFNSGKQQCNTISGWTEQVTIAIAGVRGGKTLVRPEKICSIKVDETFRSDDAAVMKKYTTCTHFPRAQSILRLQQMTERYICHCSNRNRAAPITCQSNVMVNFDLCQRSRASAGAGLFISKKIHAGRFKRVLLTFSGRVRNRLRKWWLDFLGHPDLFLNPIFCQRKLQYGKMTRSSSSSQVIQQLYWRIKLPNLNSYHAVILYQECDSSPLVKSLMIQNNRAPHSDA